MANKQYISPIRLFDHSAVPYDGDINISRIKKQLVAEFDFAKTGFIEVDGYTYNKTDVLEELDRPDFAERMEYHKRIWQTKSILTVLEDNKVDLNFIREGFDHFQNEPLFDQFFSPWFSAPFNHISRQFITENNLADLSAWLCFEDFLQPVDREEGFKSLRIFLEENSRVFKNISKENYSSFRSKIQHWITPGWERVMNNLPDEFFHFKNDLAVDLVNLTVKIQHSNKEDCRAISFGLIQLQDLPQQLKNTIYNNDSVFNNNGNRSSSSSSSGSGSYTWIIWVAVILLRLLAHGGCN